MKKRISVILLLSVLTVALVLTTLFFAIRSDFRFLVGEKLSGLFRSAEGSLVSGDCDEYTLDELREMENVLFDDSLFLVNREFMLSESYKPTIVSYKDVSMSESMVDPYAALAEEVYTRFGTKLYIRSSYRTPEEQAEIVDTTASDVAAAVGASEHQTGLALDVYVKGYAGSNFIRCDAGRFVNQECWRYGLIIRYPHGKTDITGITYEPWHIRYVGAPHAELIYKNSLTLEEYITEFLPVDRFLSYGEYQISRQKNKDALQIPAGADSIVISPDNTGYYIVTAHMAAA